MVKSSGNSSISPTGYIALAHHPMASCSTDWPGLLFRRRSRWFRLVFAILIEGGWGLLENTDMVINRWPRGHDHLARLFLAD